MEVSPSRIRYLCKFPGCGKDLTFSSMRVHMTRNPEHSKAGYKAILAKDLVDEISSDKAQEAEDEEPTVAETHAGDRATSTTSRPAARTAEAPHLSPIPVSRTMPEPTMFTAPKGFKLPVSLYQYYDIIKANYSGDFADFIAEAAIDGIIAAMRSYCEECGAAIDRCPHCGTDLPSVEIAMVVQK